MRVDALRVAAFFDRFPLLYKTVTTLNASGIPFAIGGSGCLYILGNERLPDDVDIYLPNDEHDRADALFAITSFPYRSAQEDVRNSNVDGDHSIQLTSGLVLHLQGKQYDLRITPEVLAMGIDVEYAQQRVLLYPPEDVVLIKALLQRGEDVGKHDIEDIHNFLKIYPGFRMQYLQQRIQTLEAEERVGNIFVA